MENKWSKNIYQLRKEAKITQKDLAKAVGATQKAVGFWENAVNEPKASYIIALAQFFGVTTDYLLGLED